MHRALARRARILRLFKQQAITVRPRHEACRLVPDRRAGDRRVAEPQRNLMPARPQHFDSQRRADPHDVALHPRLALAVVAEGDPEVVRKVRAVYRQIALISAQDGGWVNKLDMGDKGSKAIVLFGAPQAVEHQEERACRAALALLADTGLRSALAELRIGITAAPLFAAFVGCDERREYTVMGDGINMAARLMANAHPWRVICSDVLPSYPYDRLEPWNSIDPSSAI